MFSILLTLIGVIIGIIVTIVVSRHYFKRSFEKRLTPYIYHSSQALRVDNSIRPAIRTYYKGSEVKQVFQLLLWVTNDGLKAIRDCIEPLHTIIPREANLLAVNLLCKRPETLPLSVVMEKLPEDSTKIQFLFSLLNKYDYFLVELLSENELKPESLEFHIIVEDLPPIIRPQLLPVFLDPSKAYRLARWSYVGLGSGVIFALLFFAYGAFFNPVSLLELNTWWAYILLPVTVVLLMIFLTTLTKMIINAVKIPKKRKQFALPSNFRKSGDI